MRDPDDTHPGLSVLDRPNSYIGRSVPRPNLARLTAGPRADMSATSCCRAWRMWSTCARRTPMRGSPRSTPADAKRMPGVVAVVTGAELAEVCTPWVGVLSHLKGLKSAPQHAIAVERACWQGEAVAAVVAETRARGGGCGRTGRRRVRGARARCRHGDGARCRARPSSTRNSAIISPSSVSSTPARWTPLSRRPTRSSRRHSISAATPA